MPVCILKRFTGIGGMGGEKSRDSFWSVVRTSAAGISAGGLFQLKRAEKVERHFFCEFIIPHLFQCENGG